MKTSHLCRLVPAGLFAAVWVAGAPARAATVNVTIANFAYSPSQVSISVNDSVRWTWGGDAVPHSTTSTAVPRLWDSGLLQGSGRTFTQSFASAGNFPYFCTIHPFMTGSVEVQTANAPPGIVITAPVHGATLVTPWSGSIRAMTSDSDGTVSKVDFFANSTLLGTVLNPSSTPSQPVSGLAAGTYELSAVATDNQGASASASVTIHVVTPGPISLSAPARLSATEFRFAYSTTPGLSYVIARGSEVSTLTPVATNPAAGTSATFTDPTAAGPRNFYGVEVLPNP